MLIKLEQEITKVSGIKGNIKRNGGFTLTRKALEKRFQELELQMQETGFWDDIKRAEEVTKESKGIKDKIDRYENLVSRVDDVEVLEELCRR